MNHAPTKGPIQAVDYDPFASAPIECVAPTTEAQREVWLADQLSTQASLAYNESSIFRMRGPLSRQALTWALTELVRRHDALRTTLDDEGLQLIVQAPSHVEVPLVELQDLPEAARQERVSALLAEEVETPFDLIHGPLLRTRLLVLSEQEHLLILTAHHIICDGWSLGVLARELGALYSSMTQGQPDGLDAAPRFAEHASAQESPDELRVIEDDTRYWLAQYDRGAPMLELPTDRPRPATRQFTSRREDIWLDAELVQRIKRFSGQQGRSLFSTMLAGFGALLSRLTGQDDVVIGVPSAGQLAVNQPGLVGHCVNLLPVRIQAPSDQPSPAFLAHAHAQLLDAFDHQRCTFGTLLQRLQMPRDPSRLPLVSVMFNVDQALASDALGFSQLQVSVENTPRHFENFELFVNASQIDGALRLECQYNTSLFDQASIRHWMGTYEALLHSLIGEPAQLGRLDALSPAQRAALAAWNHTAAPYEREHCVHEVIAQQAQRTPDAPAIVDGTLSLTHAELSRCANKLAHQLRQRGIGRGDLVGLCTQRSAHMVIAQLAVLQAGAAYVPLDPAFPAERLAYMAEDAKLALLLTEPDLPTALNWPPDRTLMLDTKASAWADAGPLPVDGARDARPQDPAYVIYTSGSTGKPKGVVVQHQAVVNFLRSMAHEPGLTPGDRLVAVTTLSFDIAVLELLLPLSVGACVVLARREQVIDGLALRELLEQSQATVMQATPASWRMLIDAGWQGHRQFKSLVGGEALSPDLATLLLARTGELWNMYGPTETTVWSTCAPVTSLDKGITIGKPIANTQVHILDASQQPCPVGVPGEIYIAGEGVTLGYLHRPDLSTERFLPDPWSAQAQAHMYRTGDRGRWRHDGLLEHMGRLDFQVKVRGYRIELGEIESVLAEHRQIARAVVVVREDQPGDARLVAYIVTRQGLVDTAELRDHMRRTLPEYMLPQHTVTLDAIPLLPNGKVNRHALPVPAGESASAADAPTARIAPRDEIERQIAECMATVLKIDAVGIRSNFFELGGHSLLAAQLLSRLSDRLGKRLGLAALFAGPTVEALAQHYRPDATSSGSATPASEGGDIPHRAEQRRAPLSPVQTRMWFMEKLNPDTHIHNVPSGHRLRGPFDLTLFRTAFDHMLQRQAALRTVVVEDGDQLYQEVRDTAPGETLPFEDLSGLAPDEQQHTLERRFAELGAIHLRADEAPLFRARLFRLGPQEHLFFFMAHHIVWDGWSFDVMYRDLSELYAAAHEGRPAALPPVSITYGDYAAWQHERMAGPEGQRQTSYWKDALTPLPAPLALPLDKPRPSILDDRGATHQIRLAPALTARLVALTRQRGTTTFSVLLAAISVMLNRQSHQDEFVVGTPVWGRDKPGLEALMGLFINVLPVRVQVDRAQTFESLVHSVRDRLVAGLACPDVPFEQVVQAINPPRDLSRTPIYQVLVSYQDVRERPLDWGPLKHSRAVQRVNASAQDIGFWCVLTHDTVEIQIRYNTNLFKEGSVAAFGEDLIHVLNEALADDRRVIGELPTLAPEQAQRLAAWNATDRAFDRQATLPALFSAQARRSPQAIALNQPASGRLSYAQLDTRSNQLAHALRQRGIGRGNLVGLCLERNLDMVIAQHAVLKAGAGYVPLDPAYPADRLAYMAQDAALALLIVQSGTASRLTWPREQALVMDQEAAAWLAMPDTALPADPQRDARSQDPAYVIYTSGSTGQPKGVSVPHQAVVNFLASMAREPGLQASDRMLAVTTLSFDIAVLELMLPLTVGASITLATLDQILDGQELLSLLNSEGCNVMQATPSTWRMLIDAGWHGGPGFKALIGGEPLPQDLAAQLRPRTAQLWNMYGPTETTVWSTCWLVPEAERTVSIGRPIDNTQIHILDERMQPCPIGVSGEIWIGGDGVTLGYLNRPDLTTERFVPDPFRQEAGARLYRTGDRGRWCADGLIEHQGRLDFQVKVRGHRIELGEIEAALATHPAVSRCVVIVREDHAGDQRLVAYIVAHGQAPDLAGMRDHLRQSLPEYMLPQHLVSLAAIPLLPNGKIDRHALPAPQAEVPDNASLSSRSQASYQSDAQRQLAQVWCQLLGIGHIHPDDNFFDLGGHSLLSLTAISMMEKTTGVRVGPRRYIFESFAQLATAYDRAAAAEPEQAPVAASATVPTAPAPGLLSRLFGRKRAP